MRSHIQNKNKGFTILEVIIVISLIGIMAGALMPMLSSFDTRRRVEVSAMKLLGDLRQTQQFSRVQKDGFRYYGLRFYSGLGELGDRFGYKILRYRPQTLVAPVNLTDFDVIKGPIATETLEYVENTFFERGVIFDATSEWRDTGTNAIVFTPVGSATIDGNITAGHLLNDTNDEIVLSISGNNETIQIAPLTGYVKILE